MLQIEKHIANEMIEHAKEEYPNECCGILAGTNDSTRHIYRITNTVKSPYRYIMDPQEFLDADKDVETNNQEFLAFYHSHTHSPASPSTTDVRMALQSGWLNVHYVIVSLDSLENPQIQAFHIKENGHVVKKEFQLI